MLLYFRYNLYIEYSNAPAGYEYAVVTLYLQSNGDQKIITNPSGWNLIANRLKYWYNSVTVGSSHCR
jgi:trehalose/maltose hydrolase-like predicted phosphorylase